MCTPEEEKKEKKDERKYVDEIPLSNGGTRKVWFKTRFARDRNRP